MSDLDSILVCYRIADHPVPGLRRSTIARCTRCGAKVWRAVSSPPVATVVCMPCFLETYQAGDVIEPPTQEQWGEILGE
jgi:hypothetical protein